MSIMSATWPSTMLGLMKPSKRFQAKSWTWTIASLKTGKNAGQPWAKRLLGAFSSSFGLCSTTAPTVRLPLIRRLRILNPSTTVPSREQEPTERQTKSPSPSSPLKPKKLSGGMSSATGSAKGDGLFVCHSVGSCSLDGTVEDGFKILSRRISGNRTVGAVVEHSPTDDEKAPSSRLAHGCPAFFPVFSDAIVQVHDFA